MTIDWNLMIVGCLVAIGCLMQFMIDTGKRIAQLEKRVTELEKREL